MPDTTNRTTDASSTIVLASLLDALGPFRAAADNIAAKPESYGNNRIAATGGLASAADLYPRDFIRLRDAILASVVITAVEENLADLIHQAADTRESLFRAIKADPNADTDTRYECGRAIGVIGKLAARLMTEINTPPALPEGLRETLVAALNAELGDSYDCGRVWEAWDVGTMSEEDFTPLADRVDEIADGLIAALGKAGA